MYTCKFACQDFYEELKLEYGAYTFRKLSFDDFFAHTFDYEPTDKCAGWNAQDIADDNEAIPSAILLCNAAMD
jgi:hypothetical protein